LFILKTKEDTSYKLKRDKCIFVRTVMTSWEY